MGLEGEIANNYLRGKIKIHITFLANMASKLAYAMPINIITNPFKLTYEEHAFKVKNHQTHCPTKCHK